jgi:hypothetical protein
MVGKMGWLSASGIAVAVLLVGTPAAADRLEALFGNARAEAAHLTLFSRTTGRLVGEPVPAGATADECAAAFERAARAVMSDDEDVERHGSRVAYPETLKVDKRGAGCQWVPTLPLLTATSEMLTVYAGDGCPGCVTANVLTYWIPPNCSYIGHSTRVVSARPSRPSQGDADATAGWSYAVTLAAGDDGRVQGITPRALARPSERTGPEVWIAIEVQVSMQCTALEDADRF